MSFNFRRVSNFANVVFFSTALVACGGGGGSTSSPSTPSSGQTPTPAPETSPYSLTITEDTIDVLVLGPSSAESIHQFSDAVSSHFISYMSSFRSPQDICRRDAQGDVGSFSVAHQDVDGDWYIDEGEVVTLNYDHCKASVIGEILDGSVTMTITALGVSDDHNLSLTARVNTDNLAVMQDFNTTGTADDTSLVFSASLELTVIINDEESITVSAEENDVASISMEGVEEVFRNFSISKVTHADQTATVTFDLLADSEVMGGTFRCYSDGDMEFEYQSVGTGSIICEGDESRARIEQNLVSVDENDSGDFEELGTVAWSVIFEEHFSKDYDRLRRSDTAYAGFRLGRMTTGVRKVFSSSYTGNVMMFTTDTASSYPNSLIELNPENKSIRLVQAFESLSIAELAVSADQSQFCYATEASDVLNCHFTENSSEIFSLSLQYTNQNAPNITELETYICGIVPASENPSLYAIKLGKEGYDCLDAVIVDNGEQLASSLMDAANAAGTYESVGDELVFIKNDTALMNGFSSWRANIIIASLETSGLTNLIKLYSEWQTQDYLISDDILYAGRFRHELETFSTLGGYRQKSQNMPEVYYHARYVDQQSGLVFFAEEERIIAFDADTYAPVAAYPVDLGRDYDEKFYLSRSDSDLLLSTQAGSIAIPLDVFIGGNIDNCESAQANTPFKTVLTCGVTSVVYDSARDLIYAAVDIRAGSEGNAVKIISPENLEIIDSIFVGSEPTELKLSDDGSSLFVTLMDGAQIKRVSLDDRAVSDMFSLMAVETDDGDGLVIGTVNDIAFSPLNNNDFAVAVYSSRSGQDLYLSSEGSLSLANIENLSSTHLIFRPDGTLLALSEYRSYDVVDVNTMPASVIASGELTPTTDGYLDLGTAELSVDDGFVYTPTGAVADLQSLTVAHKYNIPRMTNATALSLDGSVIAFVTIRDDYNFYVEIFDVASGESLGASGSSLASGVRRGVSAVFLSDSSLAVSSRASGELWLINI